MNYNRVESVLPAEVIELIQQYVDGTCIYIPRKPENKQNWGENTGIRDETKARNTIIYEAYEKGCNTKQLAEKHCLSIKSIQRIIRSEKLKRYGQEAVKR